VLRSEQAAQANTQGQEANLRQVQLGIAAEVARNYFVLRQAQAQRRLVEQELAAARETQMLLQGRHEQGLADDSELLRQRAGITGLLATLPALQQQEAQAINRLSLLCGAEPGALNGRLIGEVAEPLSGPLPDLRLGLPSDLARRRPDIAARRGQAAHRYGQHRHRPGRSLSPHHAGRELRLRDRGQRVHRCVGHSAVERRSEHQLAGLGVWAAEGKSLTADGTGGALMRHGRNYLPYEPQQMMLLPESLQDWLPEGHLAHFISDTIDGLDLGAFHARYDKDGPRNQPFHPAMMVKVLVYGYATGVFSSRKIARKLHEDVAFRVLAARNFPAHRTIRDFRAFHLKELSDLFVQVVRLAREMGLVKLGTIAVDGTKVKANASRHKAMSYGHMLKAEAELKAQIEALLNRARAKADEAEKNEPELDIPAEIARRKTGSTRHAAARTRLEQRQREADLARGRSDDDDQKPRGQDGKPKGGRYKRRSACRRTRIRTTSPTPTAASCSAPEAGSTRPTTGRRPWMTRLTSSWRPS
jgi:transposase